MTRGGPGGTSQVHADIDALKGFREALVRFRHVQRGVAERGDHEIELTRASLAAKADRWQYRLEQCQAELDACRAARGEEQPADCSAQAQAVAAADERLEQIRRWQQWVDDAASEFTGTAGMFRDLLDSRLPQAESRLLAVIGTLESARRAGRP